MYIIDKNKDYYDYLSHVYGVDKKVTYDRRGSTVINNRYLIDLADAIDHKDLYFFYEKAYFLILEIGFIQYLLKIDHVKFKEHFLELKKLVSFNMEIAHIFRNNKHYFEKPISIRKVYVHYTWSWKRNSYYIITDKWEETIKKICKTSYDVDNPILCNTRLTKLLKPETIWQELSNYISALNNDKNNDIVMTDVEKAETHGFDKKTSFRHPIK